MKILVNNNSSDNSTNIKMTFGEFKNIELTLRTQLAFNAMSTAANIDSMASNYSSPLL